MAKKYYAVKIGRIPGIYETWAECEANTKGYPGAQFKSFQTAEEAEEFVGLECKPAQLEADANTGKNKTTEIPFAFVDGSFNPDTSTYGYGGFLSVFGNRHILQGSSNDEASSMRNVAGEIAGSIAAVKVALEMGLPELKIYYDYMGIEMWATGKWRTNKEWTREYATFMKDTMQKMHITFEHVKGHSGVEGNELADRLAKEAVGLLEGDIER